MEHKTTTVLRTTLNCGCGLQFKTQAEAEQHVRETLHAVSLSTTGVIRPVVK